MIKAKRNASPYSFAARATLALALVVAPAHAGSEGTGVVTGLPIPRFVSLKANPANVRVGPSLGYPLKWIFVRRFVPVEVTAEFGNWRRVRDWDASEGWIHEALLSGRRSALIAPWRKNKLIPLRNRPVAKARIIARLEAGVLVRPQQCDGKWCDVTVAGKDGFIKQTSLWGVYPGERL